MKAHAFMAIRGLPKHGVAWHKSTAISCVGVQAPSQRITVTQTRWRRRSLRVIEAFGLPHPNILVVQAGRSPEGCRLVISACPPGHETVDRIQHPLNTGWLDGADLPRTCRHPQHPSLMDNPHTAGHRPVDERLAPIDDPMIGHPAHKVRLHSSTGRAAPPLEAVSHEKRRANVRAYHGPREPFLEMRRNQLCQKKHVPSSGAQVCTPMAPMGKAERISTPRFPRCVRWSPSSKIWPSSTPPLGASTFNSSESSRKAMRPRPVVALIGTTCSEQRFSTRCSNFKMQRSEIPRVHFQKLIRAILIAPFQADRLAAVQIGLEIIERKLRGTLQGAPRRLGNALRAKGGPYFVTRFPAWPFRNKPGARSSRGWPNAPVSRAIAIVIHDTPFGCGIGLAVDLPIKCGDRGRIHYDPPFFPERVSLMQGYANLTRR